MTFRCLISMLRIDAIHLKFHLLPYSLSALFQRWYFAVSLSTMTEWRRILRSIDKRKHKNRDYSNVYWVLHFKSTFQKHAPWQASWNKAIMCVLAIHHTVGVPSVRHHIGLDDRCLSEDLHGVSGYMTEIASMLREAGISQMSYVVVFQIFWPKTTPVWLAEI